jgi:hypothetical protein
MDRLTSFVCFAGFDRNRLAANLANEKLLRGWVGIWGWGRMMCH